MVSFYNHLLMRMMATVSPHNTRNERLEQHKQFSSLKHIERSQLRLRVFQVLVAFCLLATAALGGSFGYIYFHDLENTVFKTQYYASVDQVKVVTVRELEMRTSAAESFAKTIAFLCLDWPFCAIKIKTYNDIASSLMGITNIQNIAIAPLVTHENQVVFEKFAYEHYRKSNLSSITGVCLTCKQSSPGIWGLADNGIDLIIERNLTRPMLPALQYAYMDEYNELLMFDQLSMPFLSQPVKLLMDECISHGKFDCTAITDISPLSLMSLSVATSSMIYHPISRGDQLAGFVSVPFGWDGLLDVSNIPEIVDVYMVIKTDTSSVTYRIWKGGMTLLGEGDHHDPKFSSFVKSYELQDDLSVIHFHYRLLFYPSENLYETYHSKLPLYVCVGCVIIIFFATVIFFFYDLLVKREAIEKQMILDAKRGFVRFISHEIRVPMNTVGLGLKLMQDELQIVMRNSDITSQPNMMNILKEFETLLEEVQDSSETAIIVLNDLMNYDKIEMKTLEINRQPVPIWQLIHRTVRPMFAQAKQADIELVLNLESNTCPDNERKELLQSLHLIGDGVKIGQVIRNIVSNALKFSKFTGLGKQVIVSATWDTAGLPDSACMSDDYMYSGSVTIEVKDFGPGLSPENQRQLFKEGVQFDPNKLQAGQGSGLGLWISKGIVEDHFGALSAFSEGENKGCTFYIELPVYRPKNYDLFESATTQQRGESLGSLGSIGSNCQAIHTDSLVAKLGSVRKILVVDDTPSYRKILCRMLRNEGYACNTAENGVECLEMVHSCSDADQYDLILMDYEMPLMDGPTATKLLRDSGYNKMIIGVTGNVLPSDVQFFQSHGANGVLHKPVTLNMIYEIYAHIAMDS